jgi:cytochrome oxidase assembly protein ShyY1
MRVWRHPLVLWLFAAAVFALFARLGLWQLERRAEKTRMLETVGEVLRMREARSLALAADPARRGGYDWAEGAGRFIDRPAVLLDNQQRDGRAGVRVYRAFAPAAGTPLLVELGWLPLPGDRTLPMIAMPEGERVDGLLMPPPSAGIAAPQIAAQTDGTVLATGLDMPALATQLGVPMLAPRILRLDPDAPGGYARDLDILPNTLPPDRHLGYAVQWFGLAAAVLVTTLLLAWRARRAGRRSSGTSP